MARSSVQERRVKLQCARCFSDPLLRCLTVPVAADFAVAAGVAKILLPRGAAVPPPHPLRAAKAAD